MKLIKDLQKIISYDPNTKKFCVKVPEGKEIYVSTEDLIVPFQRKNHKNPRESYSESMISVIINYLFSLMTPEKANQIFDIDPYKHSLKNTDNLYKLNYSKLEMFNNILDKYQKHCSYNNDNNIYDLHLLYDYLNNENAFQDRYNFQMAVGVFDKPYTLTLRIHQFIDSNDTKYEKHFTKGGDIARRGGHSCIFVKKI